MGFHRRAPGLKLLLIALALSTLALPMALGLLAHAFLTGKLNEATQIRFSAVNGELGRALELGPDGRLELRPGYVAPAWLSLAVANPQGILLYSSFPGTMPGQALSKAYEAASVSATPVVPGAYSFYSDVVERQGKVVGSYIARIPSRSLGLIEGRRDLRRSFLVLCAIALLAVVLGAAVSTLIASSALRLERAALAIAEGDLESPVQARGLREIKSLASAMDAMRASLAEARDKRNRFLAAVSHDLRTPLTSIGGYLEAIEDGLAEDPEVLDRYVSILRAKTRVLEERIAGLLEFAQMETREWRLGFVGLGLGPFLEDLGREFAEDARLVGRRLEVELGPAEGWTVRADPALLRRALENLLSNALRFCPPGGLARLSCQGTRTGLLILVEDEGPGISLEEREKVFEPFFRGSGAREGEGNGLGLYIALTVIQGHGWTLEVRDSPSGGACLAVAIPSKALL